MNFRSLIVFAALFGCAFSLFADETTNVFPTASGDLASASAWGGSIPDNAEIQTTEMGSYTVGADVSFKTLLIKGGSNTFTPAEGKKVTLTQTSYVPGTKAGTDTPANSLKTAFRLTSGASNTTQTFDGGLWDFSSGYLGIPTYGTSANYPVNAHLIFQNGAVVTNVGTLNIAGCHNDGADERNVMTFTGSGTQLHVNKHTANSSALLIGNSGAYKSKGRLEFLDGAQFTCESAFYFDVGAGGSKPIDTSFELLASGANSKIDLRAPIYMGWGWNAGNRIIITNGASFVSSSDIVNIGYGSNTTPAVSNLVIVTGAASSYAAPNAKITLGQTSSQAFIGHSFGNELRVLDGATFAAKGLYANYGTASTSKPYDGGKGLGVYDLGDATHDNGILVSNATVKLTLEAYAGQATYSYNGWLRILGNSVFTATRMTAGEGATSAWNSVEVRDSVVTNTLSTYLADATASRENTLYVSNSVLSTPVLNVGVGRNTWSNRAAIVESELPYDGLKIRVGGGSDSYLNELAIDSSTLKAENFIVGASAGSHDNRLTLTNFTNDYHATMMCLYAASGSGAYGNAIVASNVTLKADLLSLYSGVGAGACSNSFAMTDSVMTNGPTSFYIGYGLNANENTMALTNLTAYSLVQSVGYTFYASTNRLEIVNSRIDNGKTQWSINVGNATGACHNVYRLVDSTVVFSNAYVSVPARNQLNANSNTLEFVNVTASNEYASTFQVGEGHNNVGNALIMRNSKIAAIDNLRVSGFDSVLLFEDTPITITRGFNGTGVDGGSTNATVTFKGAKSILTLPTSGSSWTWGLRACQDTKTQKYYEPKNATLSFEDGAELRLPHPESQYVYVGAGSTGSKLRIKDGKMACHHIRVTGKDSVFEMSGEDAEVDFTRTGTYSYFYECTNGIVRITDGAVLRPPTTNLYLCFNSCESWGNTFLVEKGGKLDMANAASKSLYIGYGNASLAGLVHDNTLLVQSGGIVTNVMTIVLSYQDNHRLVIDGGQVYCSSITLDGDRSKNMGGTNNMIVVRGAGSILRMTGNIAATAGYENGLRFEVPAGGFTETPVVCEKLLLPNGTRLELDLSKFLPSLSTRMSLDLVKTTKALTIGSDVLQALKDSVDAQLAAAKCRGKLTLSDDGKTLTLKAHPIKGSIWILR